MNNSAPVNSQYRPRKRNIPQPGKVRALVAPLLNDVPCPPTDLVAVASRLETSIKYERISGSGELRRLQRGWEIVCNATLPTSRSRFTIAHELGHVLLAQEGWQGKQEGRGVERFCDAVATELLMPADVFRQDIGEELSISLLHELQDRYGASLQATAYRCAEVGKATVVEAHDGQVTRALGPLRNFTGLDDQSFRDLTKRACNGIAGSARLYLRHNGSVRPWHVLHHPLQRSGRALLLISPIKA